jgi:hypothetical protein
VSIRFTPSSTARRKTRIPSSRSLGDPQKPEAMIRIAPKPRRATSSSPPSRKVPETRAFMCHLPQVSGVASRRYSFTVRLPRAYERQAAERLSICSASRRWQDGRLGERWRPGQLAIPFGSVGGLN